MHDWGPSPVDIDDIHDYYEAQHLGQFFESVIAAEKLREQCEIEQLRKLDAKIKFAASIILLSLIFLSIIYIIYN